MTLSPSFLLSRVLLEMGDPNPHLLSELSAVTQTTDGSLWLGSDERSTLERLSPIAPCQFGDRRSFALADYLDLPAGDRNEEVDIEGLSYSEGYLWVTGSHSRKRRKVSDKRRLAGTLDERDIKRLATIPPSEINRYLLGRIPVVDGTLAIQAPAQDPHQDPRMAARLAMCDGTNVLIDALQNDLHLKTFVTHPLPSKDNGLDIEGLAVRGDRVFLGLRGPVLRGWAVLLEVAIAPSQSRTLDLQPIGPAGRLYRKHFLDLNGLGIRDLCWCEDDLLILAGPTMDLDGFAEVFRLRDLLAVKDDQIFGQTGEQLAALFRLPIATRADKAEGMVWFPCLGQPDSVLVVYDAPNPQRILHETALLADVFSLQGDRSACA
jgi:hypothetical protein